MSFIGFASRRIAKHFINKWIDENVSDPDTARVLKRVIGFSISAGAIVLSIATADGAGVVDAGSALAEHLTDTGHDAVFDAATHYADYDQLDLDYTDTSDLDYTDTTDETDYSSYPYYTNSLDDEQLDLDYTDATDGTDYSSYSSYTHSSDIKFGERIPTMTFANMHDIFQGTTEQMSSALQKLIERYPSLLGHLRYSVDVETALRNAQQILGKDTFKAALGLPKFE